MPGEQVEAVCFSRGTGVEPTWSVVAVQDGEGEEGPVTVGGEGGFGQRSQVVHVIEARAVGVVVARQQQVHVIRRLETGGGADG